MNCQAAHDLLQQCLDGMPIESPQWLLHLRECSECRELAAAGRRLQAGLHLLPPPAPPSDFAQRIAERVRRDRRQMRSRARRRWAFRFALAACLIVALSLRLNWSGTPRQTTQQAQLPAPLTATVNRQPARHDDSHTPKEKSSPTLRESAAELSEVFTALSNQTAEETVEQTRLWVSNVPSPTLPKVDLLSSEPPTRPLREAGESVSEGLEPVTTSARRAVDLFLRELPMKTATN